MSVCLRCSVCVWVAYTHAHMHEPTHVPTAASLRNAFHSNDSMLAKRLATITRENYRKPRLHFWKMEPEGTEAREKTMDIPEFVSMPSTATTTRVAHVVPAAETGRYMLRAAPMCMCGVCVCIHVCVRENMRVHWLRVRTPLRLWVRQKMAARLRYVCGPYHVVSCRALMAF